MSQQRSHVFAARARFVNLCRDAHERLLQHRVRQGRVAGSHACPDVVSDHFVWIGAVGEGLAHGDGDELAVEFLAVGDGHILDDVWG